MSAAVVAAVLLVGSLVGAVARHRRSRWLHRTPASLPTPARRRTVPASWALVALPALVVLAGPVRSLVGVVATGAAVATARSRARARRRRAVERCLPDLVDLFQLAASAGLPVAGSLAAVVPRAPPPVRAALADAHRSFRRGLPLDDALRALEAALGPHGVALLDALRRSARGGSPLAPALANAAAAARDQRLRDAQSSARRLPVLLLIPLAACTLPAAILLAVVPVLAVSLESLHL